MNDPIERVFSVKWVESDPYLRGIAVPTRESRVSFFHDNWDLDYDNITAKIKEQISAEFNPYDFYCLSFSEILSLRKLVSRELLRRGETWQDVEACTCTEADLDAEFDADCAWHWNTGEELYDWEAKPFYLWTEKFVYFSYEVRDNDWADSSTPVHCASAPRHPGNIKPERFGRGYP